MAVGHAPGWYPDPWGQAGERWWNGQGWTGDVRPADAPRSSDVFAVGGPSPAQATVGPWDGAATPVPASPAPPAAAHRVLLLGGAVVAGVGSLLPWATVTAPFVGTLTVDGTDGDGVLTLVGALIVGVLGLVGLGASTRRGAVVGALVVALLVGLVAVIDMANVQDLLADVEDDPIVVDASIGIGLWLVLLGAGAAVLGAVLALGARRPT